MVRRTILGTISLLLVISMCGCTTIRTVGPNDLQAALDSLRTGDQIAVRTGDNWQEDLTVSSVTDSSVQAKNPDGEGISFARTEVEGIRVRVGAPGKTAALAAGIFFGALGSGIPGLSL
jgi:hypothetical protein